MSGAIDISIVIPARNEAARLPALLHSLQTHLPDSGRTWEVILSDHHSTDNTTEVASRAGITVVDASGAGTVAAVRNMGAKNAKGQWLAFLDADVVITAEWAQATDALLERHSIHSRILSGCEVGGATQDSWIERVWFDVHGKDRSHINSANLLVPKKFFDELGGFNPKLRTGEDFDLSRRAVEQGGSLQPDTQFIALHDRYPNNLFDFMAREFWHGSGDFQSLGAFLRSKVALMSSSWLFITIVVIVLVGLGRPTTLLWLSPLWLAMIAGLATLVRKKSSWFDSLSIWFLYCFYFLARALSPVGLMFSKATGGGWRTDAQDD